MSGQVYIFDLDGTLIDSMPTGVGIVLSFLEKQGIPYPADMVKKLTPLGYKGTAAYYVNTLGVQTPVEEIYGYFQEQTKVAYGEFIPLKKGLLPFSSSPVGFNSVALSALWIANYCAAM